MTNTAEATIIEPTTGTNLPGNQAKLYLEAVSSIQLGNLKRKFQTPYSYILEHGRAWGPRIFPKGHRKMADKVCFMNAYKLSQQKGYKYVEGVATAIIPTDHAWCVNDAGEVIDPTWNRDYSGDYFGVEIPTEKLHRIMLLTRVYGAFGSWQHWDEILEILNA